MIEQRFNAGSHAEGVFPTGFFIENKFTVCHKITAVISYDPFRLITSFIDEETVHIIGYFCDVNPVSAQFDGMLRLVGTEKSFFSAHITKRFNRFNHVVAGSHLECVGWDTGHDHVVFW